MGLEDKLDLENREELVAVLRHRGMVHVLGMIDEIVNRMREEVLSIPLPQDAEKAAIVLYAKRCSAEGAMALKNALQSKIQKVRYYNEQKEMPK